MKPKDKRGKLSLSYSVNHQPLIDKLESYAQSHNCSKTTVILNAVQLYLEVQEEMAPKLREAALNYFLKADPQLKVLLR